MTKLINIGWLLVITMAVICAQTSFDVGSHSPPVTVTVPAGQTVASGVSMVDYRSAIVTKPKLGPVIAAIGTIDPTGVSTTEAKMIDGDLTNLAYNNASLGTTNKELPAIDLGSSQVVSRVRVYWYNYQQYMSSNYKIQGSNDAVTWTDLATNLSSVDSVGESKDAEVSGSWRYLRVFCVTGLNTNYVVITEMVAYGASVGVESSFIFEDDRFHASIINGLVSIENKGGITGEVKIYK